MPHSRSIPSDHSTKPGHIDPVRALGHHPCCQNPQPEESLQSNRVMHDIRSSTTRRTCRAGLLLQLPADLEQQFWSAPGTRAALRCLDLFASCMPFVNLILIATRRVKNNLPRTYVPFGAKVLLGVYVFISLVTLVLALTNPTAYKKHRMTLTKFGRFWRLMSGVLWTHPGTVIGFATQTAAVGRAALTGHTTRALAISILAPTTMELQHCNLHLPFRIMLPFQLTNYAVAMMWTRGMPCWLSPAQSTTTAAGICSTAGQTCSQLFGANLVEPGSIHGFPETAATTAAALLQQAAEAACTKVHLLGLLLSLPKPVASKMLRNQAVDLCEGASACQLLYMYVAGVVLLVLPLAACYTLEWFAKVRWLRSKGITLLGTPWIFPVVSVLTSPNGSSSASGTTGTTSGTGGWGSPAQSGGWLVVLGWEHVVPLLLLLVLQVPWVAAEVLASGMDGVCAPALGGPRFAWMQGLW